MTMSDISNFTCVEELENYTTIFGETALPQWEAFITVTILVVIILLTIVGNVLVILSVFTYKPLRIVPNFFIVSLAVADLTVAILVLPLNVMLTVRGKWVFGIHICKMWLTSDVLCCTASILNLCAIALDRFWAITDPINYAQKRTLKRVLYMIAAVWILSLIISCPPLIGWNDWPSPEEFDKEQVCKLSSRQGYVIYSASGSFYIPLIIMAVVYAQIFVATRRRLRERAQASRINAISKSECNATPKKDRDRDSVSSETNHNENTNEVNSKTKENKKLTKKKSKEFAYSDKAQTKPILASEESVTDVGENSSQSQKNEENHINQKQPVNTLTLINSNSKSSNFSKVVVVETPQKATVYQFIEEKQRISLSKERRAARTLGIIMGVFVFCWLPFFLLYVIVPFCESCCPSFKFINFITWLGYINSVLNPIIYTIFNIDFRRAFRKLLGLQVH